MVTVTVTEEGATLALQGAGQRIHIGLPPELLSALSARTNTVVVTQVAVPVYAAQDEYCDSYPQCAQGGVYPCAHCESWAATYADMDKQAEDEARALNAAQSR